MDAIKGREDSEFPEPSDTAVSAACERMNQFVRDRFTGLVPALEFEQLLQLARNNAIGLHCSPQSALDMVIDDVRRRLQQALDNTIAAGLIARSILDDEDRFRQQLIEARRSGMKVVR